MPEPTEELPTIDDIDRVIHEPARLQIMATLYVVDSADFLFLMRLTGFTFGNLSSHMSKLEKAGYIEVVKDFVEKKPHTMLRLTFEGKAAFKSYRQRMNNFLCKLPNESS